MFDHLGLRVADLTRSVRFYEQLLAPLGGEVCMHEDTLAGLGRPGHPQLWLHAASEAHPVPSSGVHIAFTAASRAEVDRFHAAGLLAGATDNGAPGVRPDYSERYYAAFLIDPDGNNVEAVCFGA